MIRLRPWIMAGDTGPGTVLIQQMHFPNIVVCFYKHSDTDLIRSLLGRNGYRVAYSCMSGAKALEACYKLGDGIVVCGYRLNDMLCTELFDDLPEEFDMLMLSSPGAREGLMPRQRLFIMDLPVKFSAFAGELEMIESVREQRRLLRRRQRQPGKQSRTREENEYINGAKRLLMERRGFSEQQAHRYLQQAAMGSGSSLPEAAQKLILTYGYEDI